MDGNDDVIEYPEGKVRFNKDTKCAPPDSNVGIKAKHCRPVATQGVLHGVT